MPPLNTLYNQGTTTRQLPNNGGSYQTPNFTPVSFTGEPGKINAVTGYPNLTQEQINQGYSASRRDGKILDRPIFQSGNQNQQTNQTTRSKYINPDTGEYFKSAEEYGNYVGNRLPNMKGTGDIPQYAGDVLVNQARNLNNARNDIATGTTDPYDFTKGGEITFSPQDLQAIEKAYAGIYDPALNDVFNRLKAAEDEKKKRLDREEQIFQTNENIRQWKATTGLDSSSGNNLFTRTQLNNGAANSGLGLNVFEGLDPDIKNFYINPEMELNELTNKMQPQYESFNNLIKGATSGQITSKEAAEEIMNSNLPQVVKLYFIEQLPMDKEEKKKWYQRLADWLAS